MGFIDALKANGYSEERMKKLFEKEDFDKSPETSKLRKLVDLHRDHVSEGLDYNFNTCMFFNAIDKAFDYSQHALANVALRELASMDPSTNPGQYNRLVETWGLKRFMRSFTDPTSKKQFNAIDVPAFFECVVGLVASNVKNRQAKLFSDRDVTPTYKYEPSVQTTTSHAVCEVITTAIGKQSEVMGYRAVERDIILPTLLYGYAWAFSKIDYHIEKSLWKENGKVEEYVSKQGLLWEVPHPTRVMFDRTCPQQTINTDTGISWAAYWGIVPYSTVEDNPKFFNVKRIAMLAPSANNSWIRNKGWSVYREFYPCVLKFPEISSTGVGVMNNDRQEHWYSTTNRGEAIQLVNFYHKLIPKDWDLYDCEVPVWHRFIYAGDGTLVSVIPFAYTPVNCDLYDHDSNRERNSSLALESVGWQDMLTNLLTQYVFSLNQNMVNVLFVNTEQVPKEHLETIKNLANRKLIGTHFIPFKRAIINAQSNEAGNAFHRPDMPRNDTTQIFVAIERVIAVMERILGISSQEVGSAASHQQSKEEITVITSGAESRIQLTGSFIDSGRSARARAVYDAWYEYDTKEIDQELSSLNDVQIKALKDMGFKVEKIEGTKSVKISGSRHLADMDSFAEARPPQDRMQDSKLAIAMIQAIQMLFSNPQVVEYFGIEYMMDRFNQILDYAGVPGDWRFKSSMQAGNVSQKDQELVKGILQATEQMIQKNNEVMQQGLQKELVEPIGKRFEQVDQQAQQIGEAVTQVAQKEQQVEGAVAEQQQALQDVMQKVEMIIQAASAPPTVQTVPPPPQLPPEVQGMMGAALLGG